MKSINPATGEVLGDYPELTPSELQGRLEWAAEAFARHRRTSFTERAEKMLRAAEILESEQRELGRIMTLEMGKPISSAAAEAAKCALACRYYAENAERFLDREDVKTEAKESYVVFQPLGVVLAVMPWNFPFWQVFRFAAPALMAGNVGLLKHASNVPQCALAIEDVLCRAGFDGHEFQTLLISSSRVAEVVADKRVAAVTVTGSEHAGSEVASVAGRVIKKSVLELGGSDPFIVMPSADLDAAVSTAVKARVVNSGQSCIAAKRFIVHEKIADEFEWRFVRSMERLTVGDPLDEKTDVGPLATPAILEGLEEQVARTVEAGGKVLTGGKRLPRPGNFYKPTVLTKIPTHSPAYSEELFGPVASVFRARDIDAAIALANDTSFGLGSSVWTNDEAERSRFISDIEAGQVFVNAMVASDPRLPFGGIKRSGYGRELGEAGVREFVNWKTIVVK
ncbi:MAG TPA: NAD-dependent succinate-semialdehyde dehydrogenase [Gemmatimonadaceae bacterium]|nr:NAD-dependent succinate-semialdehyde dehydrogenase [Gemmatimonadaceae bacterium]